LGAREGVGDGQDGPTGAGIEKRHGVGCIDSAEVEGFVGEEEVVFVGGGVGDAQGAEVGEDPGGEGHREEEEGEGAKGSNREHV
jgi:hypothetical protein